MRYRLEVRPAARKALKTLPKDEFLRIDGRIMQLMENPRPSGAVKMKGREDLYRIRVGMYRILYQIQDDRLVIIVVNIAHRREVYR